MHISGSFAARRTAFAFLAFFVFFAAASNAQAQSPTPTPEKDEIINVRTDLIQTNVVVVDKNNRFVEGLKPEQFELKVDGKPAKIEFFESQTAFVNAERTRAGKENRPPPGTVSSLRGRKVVFFVDDLHLSFDSLGRTRSTINHFIDDEMQPTDQVAIISSSGQIGFLQQFTDNKAVLRAALARLKFLADTFKDTDTPPMPAYTAVRIANGDRDAAAIYVQKILEGFATRTNGVNTSVNIQAVYETVKQRATNIVRGMNSIAESSIGSLENLLLTLNQTPGRKIIYFLSDGFYLQSKGGNYTENSRLQRALNLATRSGSVIYTIDARGLFAVATDAVGERPVDTTNVVKSRLAEDTAAQEGLFVLANETGGRFLKNQNYFEKWIDRTLDENASYYVLAWQPEKDDQAVSKFKRIEVSIKERPDLSARLQRGYLTNWENPNLAAGNKGAGKTAATENVSPVDSSSTKKFLTTNLSLNYLDVPNVGGVLTSSVQVGSASLDYGEGGSKPAAVDVVGLVYNEQGKQIADFKTGLSITPQSAAAGEQSVIYNHRTPLPAGLYLVKVAAREAKTGRVGIATQWIEIPDLGGKQLTLGSILLGAKTVKSNDATQQQVQFSVDHRFARPFNLNFMSFIYNAARGTGGETNLTTQIEVFDINGRQVINSPARPLSMKTVSDLTRIPITGAIRQDLFAPGKYLLRITVNDAIAKTKAVQQTVFTVE